MFAAIPSFGVQDGMPEPFSADRYDAMLKRSPFAVATPPTPAVAEPTDPFPGLYVAGISKMRFEDGTEKDRVTIKTRGDLNGGFTLIGSEPNKDGYAVTSVQSPDNWKETKVIIKKGTEFATLSFDLQSTPSAPTPTQNPPPRPVMPNQPRTPAPNGTGMNPNFTNGRNAPI
ncbi:MAG: hypothetical protein JWL90_4281, partial [Chthoniobacteraceae bacterium]|nr:hypothetical protein [Chthoniobacteraceae bacterium]